MSIDIGVFSARQWGILQANLGINNITGRHRPIALHRRKSIVLGQPISNVTLGNGLETYPGGWPRFSINYDGENHLKLRFDRDEVYGWQGLEGEPENVDGLADGGFNLIYDNDGTPIGVKFMDGNNAQPDIDWLYFIELEDNVSGHNPNEFEFALRQMEANNHLSSNPEEKQDGGKKRRKKRTKKKSRKTRKKRKKKTKKRRKKRKRKKRKTRR